MKTPKYVNRVVSRGRVYHYSRVPKSKASNVRLPDDFEAAAAIVASIVGRSYKHITANAYLAHLRNSSKQRARERGLEHDLTMVDMLRMYADQEGRCGVSGAAFSMKGKGDPFDRPLAPSLDRKDNRLGYVKGNVRLVCRMVNFAMGAWGEETFLAVARATVAKHGPGVDSERSAS